jgi:hypothetical protein
MPYANMPKSMWARMDRCVTDVKAKGGKNKNAYAVCYASIMGADVASAAKNRMKGGKK